MQWAVRKEQRVSKLVPGDYGGQGREINSLKTISTATPGTKNLDFLMPQPHAHSSENELKVVHAEDRDPCKENP